MNIAEENAVIKRATTPKELDRIYRLRYQVYVEHMGYNFPKENGPVIIDAFDNTAVNYYLEKDNEIIGTIRVNMCDLDKVSARYEHAWGIRKLRNNYAQIVYTSKLMIHPDHRSFTHLTLLCEAADTYCRENKVKLNLVDCRRELAPLYKFMGFKEYHEPFIDPILGELTPMILETDRQQLS